MAVIEVYDLDNGLVQGTFSGHVQNASGDSVYITDGFFYIKHEFNLPQVNIINPPNGGTVSGNVTISGTIEEDSDLIDVNVSIEENLGEYYEIIDREDAEGTNDWSYTFDSTQYTNGEYNVEVYARDEHYNYSRVKSITINVQN